MKRKTRQPPRETPGIAEVRRWREQLWKDVGGSIEGLAAYLERGEQERRSASPRPQAKRRRKSA